MPSTATACGPGHGLPRGLWLLTAPLNLASHSGSSGGAPERLAGEAVVTLFPSRHAHDLAQERALRTALAALAVGRAHCGIAADADVALALARCGRTAGADLLCEPTVFAPLATGFYADRVRLIDGQEAFAVKGPVSG